MVRLETPPSSSLFTSGDYISLAKGSDGELRFRSDVAPFNNFVNTININTTSAKNLTLLPVEFGLGADLRNYYYEVVEPKVIYQLSNRVVTFHDVSTYLLFNHPDNIPVNNTTWIQNTDLISSRIVIEALNGVVWEPVTEFQTNSFNSIPNWIGIRTFRSKLQKLNNSVVVFEAIGNQFNINLPVLYSTTGDLSLTVSASDPTSFNYHLNKLTLQANKAYTIQINVPNIGYTFEYVSSGIDVFNLAYDYSNITKSLHILNMPTLTETIEFSVGGVLKIFENGLLINTATSYDKYYTLQLERTNLITTSSQDSCQKSFNFVDNTTFNNEYLNSRGIVEYEVNINNTWIPIGTSSKQGTLNYTNCDIPAGLYNFRKRYLAREIPNCGGTSAIIFITDWVNFTTTVADFKPVLKLQNTNTCCLLVNTPFTVTPFNYELNNSLCNGVPDSGFIGNAFGDDFLSYDITTQNITYKLERYDISTGLWVIVNELVLVATSTPISYTFTPTVIGLYRLTGTLTNCCGSATDTITFDICNCITVKPKCKDINNCNECNKYDFVNNCSTPKTVVVKLAKTGQQINSIVVPASTSHTYNFNEDHVYQLEYDGKILILPVFCKINECYNKLLKEQLCKTNTNGCCNDKELFNSRLATIQPIYQLFLNKLNKYTSKVNYNYTSIDITNELSGFQELDIIKESLLKYCDICRLNCAKCFEWSSGSCI